MKKNAILQLLIMAIAFLLIGCEQEKEPISVTGVTLSQTSLNMMVGDAHILTATIEPSNAENKALFWHSNQPSVASVQEGVITAHKAGDATITVKTEDGNKTAICEVTVKAKVVPIESISLDRSSVELIEGKSFTLTATITPDNATNKTITWSSSDESVATVENGKVISTKEGTATIIAKTEDGNKTATCEVKVIIPILSFEADTYEINKGKEMLLSLSVEPSSLVLDNLIWTSSNDDVATVSSEGIVSAKKEGETIISVQTEDKKSIAQCKVIVTVIMPTGVKIINAINSILINERHSLLYKFEPEGAENIEMVWSSDNEDVLQVDEFGTCLALTEGVVTVSVSSLDETITDSISITVKDKYKKVGVAYLTKYGIECTVHSIDITSDGGTTKCKVSYTLKNITSDKILSECSFLCTTENNEEVNQYGFFNNLYPGESTRRSYTFKTLTSNPFIDMRLQNTFDNPIIDSAAEDLIWNLKQF